MNWPAEGPPDIELSPDLDEPGRRATLCHEMLHLERGLADEWKTDAEEGRVIKQTARWLLPDPKVVHEAIRQHGLQGAAELLRLPQRVLLLRIRKLTRPEALRVYDGADPDDQLLD